MELTQDRVHWRVFRTGSVEPMAIGTTIIFRFI